MEALAAAHSLARGRFALLFATLMLGQMSQSLTFTAFVATLPQMAHDWGGDGPFLAQMTMAVAALGMMAGSIVSGWVLERAGTRGTLVGSLIAFALSGAEGLVSADPTAMLAARFINGLAAAFMATTCLWGIAAEYEGTTRARVLGISSALSNIMAFGATLLGGYLAQLYGWHAAFAQLPTFGLVGGVLALISINQVFPSHRHLTAQREPYFRRLLPFFLFAMYMFAVRFMASTQLPFILDLYGIGGAGMRAVFIAALTVAATLTSFIYGALQQRLTLWGTVVAGLVCMAVALATIARGVSFGAAMAGSLLMGISSGVLGPYVYHVVSERSDVTSRSRAIGMVSAFCFLGGFVNPIVATVISNLVGLRNLFLLVALSMVVAALGMSWSRARSLRTTLPVR
jgi:MFS family permease